MGAKQSKRSVKTAPTKPRPRSYVNTTSANSATSSGSPSMVIEGRTYHNVESSSYCLPRDEEEQDRLNSQHFALKALFEGNILPSVQERLPADANILDMGCGSGSWVMEMAIENPEARVTGIDMADIFPTTIRPENVRFEIVNILDGLPFEDNTFDLVHMRLLVAALRVNEWPRVLNEIHRVLKPGGLVELVESDFTETEQSPKIRRFISAFLETMQERQQDPWISRKLSTLLQDSSFEVLQDELKEIHFGPDQNAIATEILWGWKEAMKTLKPLLSAKLCPNNEDYIALVDDYIKDCIENRWFVRCVAASGRKI